MVERSNLERGLDVLKSDAYKVLVRLSSCMDADHWEGVVIRSEEMADIARRIVERRSVLSSLEKMRDANIRTPGFPDQR